MPLSAVFNMFSSLANNSFNAAEAAKNRRWQEQMYDKQYQDNVNLWQMQQDYNSPENQVARLKAAGINPNLAMGQISTGSASSAPAAAQAGSGAQATGTPAHFAGLTEGVLNLLKSKDERNLLKEQANKLKSNALLDRIDAITRYEEATSRIISNLSGANKAEAERMLTMSMRQTENELRDFKKQQYVNETQESIIRQVTGWQQLKYLSTDKKLEYSERLANIALAKEQGRLTKQQALTEVQRMNNEYFKSQGQKFINELDKQTEQFLIDQRDADRYKGYTLGTALLDWLHNRNR